MALPDTMTRPAPPGLSATAGCKEGTRISTFSCPLSFSSRGQGGLCALAWAMAPVWHASIREDSQGRKSENEKNILKAQRAHMRSPFPKRYLRVMG